MNTLKEAQTEIDKLTAMNIRGHLKIVKQLDKEELYRRAVQKWEKDNLYVEWVIQF